MNTELTTTSNGIGLKTEQPVSNGLVMVDNQEVVIRGAFPRVAKLYGEHHEYIENPKRFLSALSERDINADLFTFLPPVHDLKPHRDYRFLWDNIALLKIESYEHWWTKQVNDKTRNMVRKAGKKGVEIALTQFDDALAGGIHAIYNESPLVQGMPSRHFGKDFETLKKAHATYLDKSVFIEAKLEGKLIGFIKMIMGRRSASIMGIMSLMSERNKSPSNALVAKAIETCAERGIEYLQYGIWSRRGLGDFKKHLGFECVEIPRYFVPLNIGGRLALGLQLHRDKSELIPAKWRDWLAKYRTKWYLHKFRSQLRR